MKKILTAILVINSSFALAQENESLLPKIKEDAKPEIQVAQDEAKGEPAAKPPAYIYETHLPPENRKKEVEEAERRAYVRPELIIPE